MTNISRIHRRALQRQADKAKGADKTVDWSKGDRPVQVIHGHDKNIIYFTIDPLPPNGWIGFTEDQYAETIKSMEENLAAFRARDTKGST